MFCKYIESDISKFHSLSHLNRMGHDLLQDCVFLCMPEHLWKLFVSFTGGLFTCIMIRFQLCDHKDFG